MRNRGSLKGLDTPNHSDLKRGTLTYAENHAMLVSIWIQNCIEMLCRLFRKEDESMSARQSVAIVGAGTIGLSWATLFASHGWDVRVTDPRPDLEKAIAEAVKGAVPAFRAFGTETDEAALGARIVGMESLDRAVEDVALVQENGPERLDWKQELFVRLERLTNETTVLATSSSSIPASAIVGDAIDGSRIIVGHPYNPPHVIPVVEVVPSERTSQETIERATEIYTSLGRDPVVLKKEVPGFVGNRLQLALLREALYLVHEGVVDPTMLDRLMRGSLGLRWAAVGPLAAMRLGGGPGGAKHLMENVGKEMEHIELRSLSPEEMATAAAAVDEAYGDEDYASAARNAGSAQIAVLTALAKVRA